MILNPKLREKIKTTLSYASLGGGWSAFLLALQYGLLMGVIRGTNFGNCNYSGWDADNAHMVFIYVPIATIWGGIVGLVGGLLIAFCAFLVFRMMKQPMPRPKHRFVAVLLVATFGWLGMIIGGAVGWLQDVYHPIAPTSFEPYSNRQTISGLTMGLILGNFFGIAFGGAFSGITKHILKSITSGFRLN